jgi:hypothetical protein
MKIIFRDVVLKARFLGQSGMQFQFEINGHQSRYEAIVPYTYK